MKWVLHTRTRALSRYPLLGLLLFTLFFPLYTYGQANFGAPVLDSPLELTLSPRTPQPNSTVEAHVQSFSVNLNNATVSWFVNNRLVEEGGGLTSFTLTTGSGSTRTALDVVVRTDTGALFRESIIIRPASVDLVWEAQSYTPPFYKGKALWGIDSNVRITALPYVLTQSGVQVPPRDLVFTWKQGSHVLGNMSGRGRDSIVLEGLPFVKALEVGVEVQTVEGEELTAARTFINPVSPFITFYESHPTRGVRLERALESNFILFSDEVTLVAQPYFFAARERSDTNLKYAWELNNKSVDNPNTDKSTITLRPTGSSGRALLNISLRHDNHVLQQADSALSVQFSSDNPQFTF